MVFIFKRKADRSLRKNLRRLKQLRTEKEQLNFLINQKDLNARKRLFFSLNDESLLIAYLIKAPENTDSIELISLLKSNENLAFLFRRSPSVRIKRTVIECLTSEALMKELLQEEKEIPLILDVIKNRRLSNQLRYEILFYHRDTKMIQDYVKNSGDLELLLKFACEREQESLRREALTKLHLEKIPDEAKLALLRVCENPGHIQFIINSLDTGTLAEIAKGRNQRINREIDLLAREKGIPLLQQLIASSQ